MKLLAALLQIVRARKGKEEKFPLEKREILVYNSPASEKMPISSGMTPTPNVEKSYRETEKEKENSQQADRSKTMPRKKVNPEDQKAAALEKAEEVKAEVAEKAEEVKETAKKTARKTTKAVKDAAETAEFEVKKTARSAGRKAKAKAEEVKEAVDQAVKKAETAKVNVIVQSPLGGNITTEEIVAKLPEGVDSVFVRVDQNKLWWVKGEETGSVEIW